MEIADQRKAGDLDVSDGRTPPGPHEAYRAQEDFLEWMSRQFALFGDIYKATISGCSAYVIRNVEFAHEVLVENCQNHMKGQDIGRTSNGWRYAAPFGSKVGVNIDCVGPRVATVSLHSRKYLDRSLAETQVSQDSVNGARSTQRKLVPGRYGRWDRVGAPRNVSDSLDPGPQRLRLDESRNRDRAARCLAVKCAMSPSDHWVSLPGQSAIPWHNPQGRAAMAGQQFAGCRIQRVSEDNARRELRSDQFFACSGNYIHRQHCCKRSNLFLYDSGGRRARPRKHQFQ